MKTSFHRALSPSLVTCVLAILQLTQKCHACVQMIRLGRTGYTLILQNLLNTAKALADSLTKTG